MNEPDHSSLAPYNSESKQFSALVFYNLWLYLKQKMLGLRLEDAELLMISLVHNPLSSNRFINILFLVYLPKLLPT